MRPAWCFILVCGALVSGCAGYRLGPSNGEKAGARSVRVDLFRNETLEPRLTEAVGVALRRVLQQEGTYRLSTRDEADIILRGTLVQYQRAGLSYEPRDTITPRDFQITLFAKVTATERATGRVLLDREVRGRTTMRVGPDFTSSERQAMPTLADDLARNITSLLADGSW